MGRAWAMLAGAVVLEVGATISLRQSDGFRNPVWLVPIVVGYVGAFWLLARILRCGMPVGVAYGVWSASGVALTAVLGAVLFDEPFSPAILAGIVLIMAGVLLMELGGSTGRESE